MWCLSTQISSCAVLTPLLEMMSRCKAGGWRGGEGNAAGTAVSLRLPATSSDTRPACQQGCPATTCVCVRGVPSRGCAEPCDSRPGQTRDREILSCHPEWPVGHFELLFISGTFHLIFSDHSLTVSSRSHG